MLYQIEKIPADFNEQKYLQSLSAEETNRFMNMKDPQRKRQFLFCRHLIKTELALKLSCLPYEIQFEYGPNGKPFLVGNPYYFSISHSKNDCAYAISEKKIGIDIQLHKELTNLGTIATKVCHANEIENINLENFYRIWVIKEAYSKALGDGMQSSYKSLDFSKFLDHDEFSHLGFRFAVKNSLVLSACVCEEI